MHKGVCPSCDLRKMGKDDATLRLLKNTSKVADRLWLQAIWTLCPQTHKNTKSP